MIILDYIPQGALERVIRVFLYKDSGASAGTEGDPITGLSSTSSGLTISTMANNEATPTVYSSNSPSTIEDIQSPNVLGTYAAPTAGSCRFEEVDATNHPGLYELHFETSRLNVTDVRYLDICISGVTDLAPLHGRVYQDLSTASDIREEFRVQIEDTALGGTLAANSIGFILDRLSTDYTTQRAAYLDNINTDIPTELENLQLDIAALNDLSQADIRLATGLASANLDTQLGSLATAASIAALNDITASDVWANTLGTTNLTASQLLQIIAGVSAGKITGAATTSITIRNIEDDENMIVATVDINGNRSAISITNPST